jgi:DNA-directed RNA polymerase subunit RPC12/RpoP
MTQNIRNQFSKWHSVKVKARYNYTCAKCGSTENIQAHDPTKQHNDWYVGIALCGDCHSNEHPEVPKGLFGKKEHQPYWTNVSARTLSKEIGCHSRTIIRRSRKLNIPMGKPLSENDRKLIKDSFLCRTDVPKELVDTHDNEPTSFDKTGKPRIPEFLCLRCGHLWIPRRDIPKKCPRCNSPYWNKMRKAYRQRT